jgi:hypothetical protein
MRPQPVAPKAVAETPAEVAEEIEAEAEMVFEGGPPEPAVRAEAAPEPEAETPGETTPAPPVLEPVEQPVAAPERESESTGSAVIDEQTDTPERSESTSVETDTQGSSSDEELL